jgi:hypothetical protein
MTGVAPETERIFMNDVSPLVLMFAMFVICLGLVLAGVMLWAVGHLKRLRLTHAVTQLGEILKLTDEALQSQSAEQQNVVNHRIAEWDKIYSHEIGVTIRQLSWA